MIHDFTAIGPQRVISGIGALARLPAVLDSVNARRAMVVTGSTLAGKTDLVSRV